MDAIDIEVFDEAQILPSRRLRTWCRRRTRRSIRMGRWCSSWGRRRGRRMHGEAFTAKRRRLLSGKSKDIAFVELSAADEDADPDDYSSDLEYEPVVSVADTARGDPADAGEHPG
jgi:hypothetical protein